MKQPQETHYISVVCEKNKNRLLFFPLVCGNNKVNKVKQTLQTIKSISCTPKVRTAILLSITHINWQLAHRMVSARIHARVWTCTLPNSNTQQHISMERVGVYVSTLLVLICTPALPHCNEDHRLCSTSKRGPWGFFHDRNSDCRQIRCLLLWTS